LYRRGEASPVEVVEAHLRRCEELNPVLNAFLVILRDSAVEAARAAEALFRAGVDLGPLQGVPVSVKDLIRVRGTRTTAASRVLLSEPPDSDDAPVVRQLRRAGAVIIGKTNLHEFATGDPDPAGPFGLVQNPRRIGHHPGSSSSGAGAAAAAGLGVIAIGTDTGGSVRIPAYLCGVAGLKPTNGLIDLEGIIPLSPTLDTVGPLARRVRDLGAVLEAWIGGLAEGISPSHGGGGGLADPVTLRGWRVGAAGGNFFRGMQPEVSSAFAATLGVLRERGCRVAEFEPPGMESMYDLNLTITQAEGSAVHEAYRDRESLYGRNFRERILVGREMKALTYLAARRRQAELQREWTRLVRGFDVLVLPSGPAVAPPHGVTTVEIGGEKIPFRKALSLYTRPANLLGWPALTVPDGFNREGLPTGIQILGPPRSEACLLALGQVVEDALGVAEKLGIEPRRPG
jgi:aspartyl-tRNA(Asn)/glutamyl-tRNA(Gln) amidotransferase subunit A